MGVGSARGTVIGFVVRTCWGGSSLVVAGEGSNCGGTVVVVGEEAVGGVASCTGMGVGSDVPSVVGSPLGGVGFVTINSSCGFDTASSRGLSGSSTVSTICRLVAFLFASFYWS